MVDIDDAVIDEATHEGESMLVEDLVDLIERYHDDEPGVPREAVIEYVRELATRADYSFNDDAALEQIDERITDAETWDGRDHFYELDGDRLSQYPARWHDHLGGSTDVAEYVRFIQEEVPEFIDDLREGGAGSGIPEDRLVNILQVVGLVDRDTAIDALKDAMDRGDVVEDADQHPQANVSLPEHQRDRQ